ncbi:MAG: division plane positioning ATPase MipZ [Gammaproteobacteria bacterium]
MITVLANLKGGSGKSTVTFNLAIWLLHKSVPVKVIDLDPQQTISDVTRIRSEDGHEPTMVVETINDIEPSEIQAFEGEVLVDVGAANLDAMRKVISVADRVIIPVPPSQPDVWATQRFLKLLGDSLLQPVASEVVTFINRADTHTAIRESDEAEEALESLSTLAVVKNRLCNRTIYRRSMSEGLAVFEMKPSSKAAKELNKLALSFYPDFRSKRAVKSKQAMKEYKHEFGETAS